MPLPNTTTGLLAAGYTYYTKSYCRGCKEEIEFWTTPKGKLTPLDPGTLVSHFSTCPNADSFRDPAPKSSNAPFSAKTDGYRKPRG